MNKKREVELEFLIQIIFMVLIPFIILAGLICFTIADVQETVVEEIDDKACNICNGGKAVDYKINILKMPKITCDNGDIIMIRDIPNEWDCDRLTRDDIDCNYCPEGRGEC